MDANTQVLAERCQSSHPGLAQRTRTARPKQSSVQSAAKVGKEPMLTDAAVTMNGGFVEVDNRSLIDYLPSRGADLCCPHSEARAQARVFVFFGKCFDLHCLFG